MTKPLDPYSRVYWRVLDDERFDAIRADMRHFGSWTLMLVVADMAYPAPAFVPSTIPKASLAKLVEVGLIESVPGGLYRVHGLAAERSRRWSPRDPDGTPRGTGAEPERSLTRATAEPSKDETSKAEHFARAGLPNLDREAIRALEERTGRPWSLAGDKQLSEYDRLIEDHGLAAVLGAFDAVRGDGDQLTARQLVWPAMKLLEPMPSAKDAREQDRAHDAAKRDQRTLDGMWARRIERFRFTGEWDEAWGPEPEGAMA